MVDEASYLYMQYGPPSVLCGCAGRARVDAVSVAILKRRLVTELHGLQLMLPEVVQRILLFLPLSAVGRMMATCFALSKALLSLSNEFWQSMCILRWPVAARLISTHVDHFGILHLSGVEQMVSCGLARLHCRLLAEVEVVLSSIPLSAASPAMSKKTELLAHLLPATPVPLQVLVWLLELVACSSASWEGVEQPANEWWQVAEMQEEWAPPDPPLRSLRNQLARRCVELVAPDQVLEGDAEWLGVLRCSVARCFAACCHRYGGGFVGAFELLAGERHIASLRRGLVRAAVSCVDIQRCKLLLAVVEAHQSTSRDVGSWGCTSAENFAQVLLEIHSVPSIGTFCMGCSASRC
mmetsp:Transcript_30570/g.79241  ORF Transcript_30570/g.79241 Transcript_30570/m.79241 type:complete len:352 (+) Transcript_30570:43-1098(+)